MTKIITFSLWGNNPKYTIGAIKNADLALQIYPDWICRFYCAKSVPFEIIKELQNKKNCQLIFMEDEGNWEGMFWRFLAAEDSDVMISRDTDSRLNLREKAAVDEWIQSNKSFHIMRDHPYHQTEILGGMWGVKSPVLKNIKSLISNYKKGNFYQVDQNFLKEIVYPIIKNDILVHDEFFEKKPFPIKRNNFEFVGQVFDENDVTVEEHLNIIKQYI